MNIIMYLVDFIINIDKHLLEIIQIFDLWSYAILFLIVFVETGIVIFPFLPGDSLLFASGAFAAKDAFNIVVLILLFFAAAVLGDTVNYHIGKKAGTSISRNKFMNKVINQEKMEKAESFFNKHGGKTIVMARFMPFIRTFIPFIAGVSHMNYRAFIAYNIVGGALWVTLCTVAGYFFGNLPIVQENFSLFIILIIIISLLPAIFTYLKNKFTVERTLK
ncbi:DedA family protein [Lederbergia galactosidilytica]|uniref:Cytochrome O ubiquinol oxidase n=1 Tax=Lederbergia galactosidilytica TaxID=217031 RepID=A0A0Q9XW05_9BACI|nr:DedA family protein [Lederbergia galactosidilytica]KRG12655.1 cytochrome O ubiquinol oxidase [Lederbergia galactosidilytica]KRG13004.1 cytochrome O ubiquinol oxidase [Virgibacillus soli]OAK70123.1 cytochrome O ubiquinol oxidase [Lederbergia galactosidilytica]